MPQLGRMLTTSSALAANHIVMISVELFYVLVPTMHNLLELSTGYACCSQACSCFASSQLDPSGSVRVQIREHDGLITLTNVL
mmetsp:Transcript_22228/g.38117  ORF Transcript_22228/g.38117 Transcript_22228/m.38117 type:complete len:83 (-) Transcript_22228:100-348(-)